MTILRRTPQILLVALALALPVVSHAEIVEEIVAWVNGEIITLSEYREEEQAQVAELYRQVSGEELDRQVEVAKEQLLLSLIDRKIMLHHARAMGYDLDMMAESYVKMFMQQQGIKTEEELRQMASRENMSVDEIRGRLVEMHGPRDLVDMEVANRISVSEAEIVAYYENNPEKFEVEGEVTLREIVLLADSAEAKEARAEEVRAVWQRAAEGEEFATLAAEVSEAGTAAAGGRIGPLTRSDLSEALAEPAFDLPVGAMSEPMETPYGFHIVKVVSRTEDRMKPLDEMRDRIRDFLHQQMFTSELEAFLEKARAESEWCVKPKHQHLLAIPAPPSCERL